MSGSVEVDTTDSSTCSSISGHKGDVEGETEERPSSTTPVTSRWFEDHKYCRYWKHYRKTQDWFNKHYVIVNGLNNMSISRQQERWNTYMYHTMLSQWCGFYYNMMQYWSQFQGCMQSDTDSQSIRGSSSDREHVFKKPFPPQGRSPRPNGTVKRKNHSKKMKQKRRRRHSRHSISVSDTSGCESRNSNCSKGSSVSFEMEITGDMMEFFAKSAKHKQEMAAIKKIKKEKEKEEGEYVPLTEATGGKRTTLPPSERPGVRRTAEMKQLYGHGAAMIHGMETAMQLTYDRHFDNRQPKLWPNLPLKIKF